MPIYDSKYTRNQIDEGIGASYVPTLNSAPTTSTLTYTRSDLPAGSQTVSFVVGQLCRVANANIDNGFRYYILLKLTTTNGTTTATWCAMAVVDDVDDLPLPEGEIDPDDWEDYFQQKADKATTVTNVAYDGTNKKITKTINGVTTDVVTLDTMKTDMGITFSGSYNDLTDKPESLPANGGNSATVNNHTVNADVPADAVFTDTTYSTMGASGSGHAGGLVPDTPSTAGTTKFLREDGSWQVPDYPTTLPASDVSAWAKESTKPTYIMSEVSLISVVPISYNTTSSCSITGSSNAGKAQTIIYTNSSTTTARTVTVPTTYKTPDGQAITLNCPAGGYCEVSYLNINGTVYARGV